MALLRADLHVHTVYSGDCLMTPQQIVDRCLQVGIDCLAVTDHNCITGALETRRIAPFPIIVGEEVLTTHGEIIGYFLSEEIPRGLSPEETAKRIHQQGGLVCVPHPYDRLRRRSAIRRHFLEPLLPYLDIVEVFNSRCILYWDGIQARRFAEAHGLLFSAGSDAHTPGEIGNAGVELAEFNDAGGFRHALAEGRVFGRRTNPLVHLSTLSIKARNLLKRKG